MCGIIGYTGPKAVAPILIDGLKRLEYRGYDSAGLSVFDGKKIVTVKKKGFVGELEKNAEGLQGFCGIGHTRWATHGAPSDSNSHPHLSGKFALVHNGIIENFDDIKRQLKEKGKRFLTDTDSEAAVRLIDDMYEGDVLKAVCGAVKKMKGSFAFAILCKDFPDKVFVVKKQSPLVVGLGDGECFVASDCMAFSKYTDKAVYLKDNEVGVVDKNGLSLFDFNLNKKNFRTEKTDIGDDYRLSENCSSFMYKEIFESPKALQYTAADFFADTAMQKQVIDIFSKHDKVIMLGCGTAYNACLVGKNVFEKMLDVDCETELASEFRYKNPKVNSNTLVIAVSQSGETADTIAAVKLAKAKGAGIAVITNVRHSSLTRFADVVLHTKAGAEVAVAATKSYLTQTLMFLLVATLLRDGSKVSEEIKKQILKLPQTAEQALKFDALMQKYAKKHCQKQSVFFIGRGMDYALAAEGTLKLKEVSYIHSEGFAAGELKHGTLALIDKNALVIAIATQRNVAEKTVNALHEVTARGGKVILLTCFEKLKDTKGAEVILLPQTGGLLMTAPAIIPLQLFAYHMSVERGINPDKPRNLAKSVTVE